MQMPFSNLFDVLWTETYSVPSTTVIRDLFSLFTQGITELEVLALSVGSKVV